MSENDTCSAFFPVTLRLAGVPVLVVGLGKVGCARARVLAAAGARVCGVDPNPTWGGLPESIQLIQAPYRHELLEGHRLVCAAATPDLNETVVQAARARGIWVNNASNSGQSDFVLPAVHRDGPVLLAISTSGCSPSLSSVLRDRMAATLPRDIARFARLLAEFRSEVIATIANPRARRALLMARTTGEWLDLLERHGIEAVHRRLQESSRTADPETSRTLPCDNS